MKPRRTGRMRRKSSQLWAIQRHRLQEIAEGRIEPWFEREHLFLWTLRARGIVNPPDFILPGLLFMAETLNKPLNGAPSAS